MKDRITGTHIIVDICKIDSSICLAGDIWLTAFGRASRALGLNSITSYVHTFKPPQEPGITAYLLLDASHFSVHTYANRGLAALDLFACKVKSLDSTLQLILREVGISDKSIVEKRTIMRFLDK